MNGEWTDGTVKDWKELAINLSNVSGYFNFDGTLNPADWEKKNDIAKAKQGVEVIVRRPNELLLDLDNKKSMEQYEEMIEALDGCGAIKRIEGWKSKSGNSHIKITFALDLTPLEATTLQAILGSDPRRELLNLIGHLNGIPEPSKLYKYPEDKTKKISRDPTKEPF